MKGLNYGKWYVIIYESKLESEVIRMVERYVYDWGILEIGDEIFVKDVCISVFNSGLGILGGFDKFDVKLMKLEFIRMWDDLDDSDLDEVLRLKERYNVLLYLEDWFGSEILVKGIYNSGMCSSKYEDCEKWWKKFKKFMESKLVVEMIDVCNEMIGELEIERIYDKIVGKRNRSRIKWVGGN